MSGASSIPKPLLHPHGGPGSPCPGSPQGQSLWPPPAATTLLPALRTLIGENNVRAGGTEPSTETDWRGRYHGKALAILRPGSTAEVAGAVALCAARGVTVVPQGGNTGLCGGATPDGTGLQVVLCLSRLNQVRAVDPDDPSMVAEAGVTLQAARDAAAAAGCTLPLWIASGGTAQLGGLISTNAGGIEALRHGAARDLVLGLEVVLADGRVWNGLRRLRRESAGYALRHLFAGAEGTLGIITAAALRLAPARRAEATALCAVPDPDAALALLRLLRAATELVACEYISGPAMAMVLLLPGARLPLTAAADHYLLVEVATARAGTDPRAELEAALAQAMAASLISDAVLAESRAQRLAIWRLREDQAEAQRRAGPDLKNDIAVPVGAVPALLRDAIAACARVLPGCRVVPFGHLGDGNIHLNIVAADGMDAAEFARHVPALADAVEAVAAALGGSFSAEHGIGQLKLDQLARWRGGVELEVMQRIRAALDPAGVLNPGRVLRTLTSVLPEPVGSPDPDR